MHRNLDAVETSIVGIRAVEHGVAGKGNIDERLDVLDQIAVVERRCDRKLVERGERSPYVCPAPLMPLRSPHWLPRLSEIHAASARMRWPRPARVR